MMKKRLFKKMQTMAIAMYDLNVRRCTGGMGGCVPINGRERTKYRKLERMFRSHPRFREYDLQCEREMNRQLALYDWD